VKPDDLRGEIDEHLQEKIDDLVESGGPEAEARLQALREFGNAARYAEESREVSRWACPTRSLSALGKWECEWLSALSLARWCEC
jgi:hypothetical protein